MTSALKLRNVTSAPLRIGARVVFKSQLLVIAAYLSCREHVFLQEPDKFKLNSVGDCVCYEFVVDLSITELEQATSRTWVGPVGLSPLSMKSYSDIEQAVKVLARKPGHRIAVLLNRYYVAPIQSDFVVTTDPLFASYCNFELLSHPRYINE